MEMKQHCPRLCHVQLQGSMQDASLKVIPSLSLRQALLRALAFVGLQVPADGLPRQTIWVPVTPEQQQTTKRQAASKTASQVRCAPFIPPDRIWCLD